MLHDYKHQVHYNDRICLLMLFPLRPIGSETSLKSVSRGFLLGDVFRVDPQNEYRQTEKGVHVDNYGFIQTKKVDVEVKGRYDQITAFF